MPRSRIVVLMEIALMAALAMLLDWIIPSTHGLKITVKMIPIIVLALRRGLIPGMAGGFLWGLLQIVTGEAYILNFVQATFEYIVAFTVIGLAGLLYQSFQAELKQEARPAKLITYAGLALLVGSLLRYFCHFIAGIAFWSEYAPEGQSAAIYSLSVNGTTFLSETITCIVALVILLPFYKQLMDPARLSA